MIMAREAFDKKIVRCVALKVKRLSAEESTREISISSSSSTLRIGGNLRTQVLSYALHVILGAVN